MAILLLSVPPIAVSKQTGLTSTSFSLRSFRRCSLLNLLPQLEGFCSSQQAGILKLQAHFLSAAVFTSHPCAFALTYCWNDGGSNVFSSATLLVLVCSFFLPFPEFPGFRNGWLRKRQGVLGDRWVGREVS